MPLTRSRYGGGIHRRDSIRRPLAFSGLPNGLTVANLFCGIYAIVLAARHDFSLAGMYIVIGGIFDALDGRVARATNSGSRLGAELDSLVDAISFGFAPAMIMFFAVLNQENWSWILVFLYTTCACFRLARFNVMQSGRAKRYFQGLPSPAAGLTLATYYWFSQTPLYKQTMIANVPWNVTLYGLMLVLSVLMISNVPYPAVPTVGYKNARQIVGSVVVVGTIVGLFEVPKEFFFPACVAYVLYGVGKTVLFGLLGKRDTALLHEVGGARRGHSRDVELDEEPDTIEPTVLVASSPHLSVTADTPLPPAPQRNRRRRRPTRLGGERPDRPERGDRPERDRPDRGDRPERDRSERGDRGERRPRPEQDRSPYDESAPSERGDDAGRTDSPDRMEQSEGGERAESSEQSERLEPSGRPERPERSGRGDRPGRRDRFNRSRRSRRPDRSRPDRFDASERPDRSEPGEPQSRPEGPSAPPANAPPFSPPSPPQPPAPPSPPTPLPPQE